MSMRGLVRVQNDLLWQCAKKKYTNEACWQYYGWPLKHLVITTSETDSCTIHLTVLISPVNKCWINFNKKKCSVRSPNEHQVATHSHQMAPHRYAGPNNIFGSSPKYYQTSMQKIDCTLVQIMQDGGIGTYFITYVYLKMVCAIFCWLDSSGGRAFISNFQFLK